MSQLQKVSESIADKNRPIQRWIIYEGETKSFVPAAGIASGQASTYTGAYRSLVALNPTAYKFD